MGFIKFIGGILIFFSTTLLGFYYGGKYSHRLRNLIYMEQCIKILETEIVYGAILLPDALTSVYNKGNKCVSFIFESIKDCLLNNKKAEVYDSFIHVEPLLRDKLYFKEEDIEMFLSLGRIVGSSNRQDQEKNFKLILNRISVLEREAELERDKNEKMFKNLGILAGLAIIILLV